MLRALHVVNVHTHNTYGIGTSLHSGAMRVDLKKEQDKTIMKMRQTWRERNVLAFTRFHLCQIYFVFKWETFISELLHGWTFPNKSLKKLLLQTQMLASSAEAVIVIEHHAEKNKRQSNKRGHILICGTWVVWIITLKQSSSMDSHFGDVYVCICSYLQCTFNLYGTFQSNLKWCFFECKYC